VRLLLIFSFFSRLFFIGEQTTHSFRPTAGRVW
jgi:hypothetical protein